MNFKEYCHYALYIFLKANHLMFQRDIEEIRRNVSERSFCANLKEFINAVILEEGYEGYIADVEYNRGGDQLIKAIYTNNEEKPIQCDLIIHSRGKLTDDNLLCVEVKKKDNKYKVNEDRERLCEMTKRTLDYKTKNNRYYFVSGYKLGIFYVYDYKKEVIEFELYSHGEKIQECLVTFEELICEDYIQNYMPGRLCVFYPHRSITFYNMGFGDSFLIKDHNFGLLVDCGSLNVDAKIWNQNKLAILFDAMHSRSTDLLITHYHMDHLNKIKELSDAGLRFNHIYVRNINNNNFAFDIKSFFIELVYYSKITEDYNPLLFWLNPNLLFHLLTRGGRVIGINNAINNLFNIGSSTAEVLWPEPNIVLPLINFDSLLEKYPTCFKHLNRLIRLYNGIAETNADNVFAALDRLNNHDIRYDDEIKYILIKEILDISEDKEFYVIKSKLSSWENRLSVVFSIDDKLLMCGDATKTSLNKALISKKNVQYRIIKVPHHGTTPYLSKIIYKSNSTFLIPNSEISGKKLIDSNYCVTSKCHCLNCSVTTACMTPSCSGRLPIEKRKTIPF